MMVVLVFAVILLLSTDLFTGVSSQTSSSESISAPGIEWQENYGGSVAFASNLIQTSDGGYVFMNLGWYHSMYFFPATVYKVDSSGSLQWEKTVEDLEAINIIETNDGGYEITGKWRRYTPTLVKMDSQGNVQWVANYSSVPDLGVASTSSIQTSDGGFAYWTDGNITKTDSDNNTQWVKTLYYTGFEGMKNNIGPLETLSSVIVTSDGALAALGIGLWHLDNYFSGSIYLIKTEAFLPLPSQAPLPTPLPTPLPVLMVEAAVMALVIVGVVVIAGLLVFLKKRKH
jgi:hypothetical protein